MIFRKKIFNTTTLTKTKNNNKQVGIGFGSFFLLRIFLKQKKSKVKKIKWNFADIRKNGKEIILLY